ncbi:calmodulin [Eurytemora carolleeae]|uniref:calmodulin n=1 Tax=Eurytemora carolleeae TaxID=1294199 RepID=UPI000C78F272|nr:calmodulin [Eurytemora carolleeae]|eukprot:XP_023340239.1 calmodulin-like [Eurytemora affinis]
MEKNEGEKSVVSFKNIGRDDSKDELEREDSNDDIKSPNEDDNKTKVVKSTSNLFEALHAGRPKDEEPHVKKTIKNKKEKTEYILRVDTDELGIAEDEFEDLQSLFQLFDHDMDGVLSIREACRMLNCLGFPSKEEQIKNVVGAVSIDKTGFSLSFNEFISLVSIKRREDPNQEALMQVFKTFDDGDDGRIQEIKFRQIMKGQQGLEPDEVDLMIQEYFTFTGENREEDKSLNFINYAEFVAMLQG